MTSTTLTHSFQVIMLVARETADFTHSILIMFWIYPIHPKPAGRSEHALFHAVTTHITITHDQTPTLDTLLHASNATAPIPTHNFPYTPVHQHFNPGQTPPSQDQRDPWFPLHPQNTGGKKQYTTSRHTAQSSFTLIVDLLPPVHCNQGHIKQQRTSFAGKLRPPSHLEYAQAQASWRWLAD